MSRAWLAAFALLAAGCGGTSLGSASDDTLARYDLLDNDGGRLTARPGVVAYDVRNGLFADHALKSRLLRLPPGTAARYDGQGAFDFPVGTVAAKSFGYAAPDGAARWIETRLLVHEASGWRGYVYQWDEAQTEARRVSRGADVALDLPGAPASHAIPRESECTSCHGADMKPIGLRAVELNTKVGDAEQLVRWSEQGLLERLPALTAVPRAAVWDDPATGTTAERARAYVDANCSHCHSENGLARGTGLFLGLGASDPGRCMPSGMPSTPYVVAPGAPDRSFLLARVESVAPGEMMPPIGRAEADADGAALLRAWIGQMPGSCP
jgi:uncharacterized repeat protein (TIGR03806 family)